MDPERLLRWIPVTGGKPGTVEALARSPGRLEACPTLGPSRFMVPMHAQVRKEALPAAQGEGIRAAVLSTLRSTPKGNEKVRHNSQWPRNWEIVKRKSVHFVPSMASRFRMCPSA